MTAGRGRLCDTARGTGPGSHTICKAQSHEEGCHENVEAETCERIQPAPCRLSSPFVAYHPTADCHHWGTIHRLGLAVQAVAAGAGEEPGMATTPLTLVVTMADTVLVVRPRSSLIRWACWGFTRSC